MERMFHVIPDKRITIDEVLAHKWFKGEVATPLQLFKEFGEEQLIKSSELDQDNSTLEEFEAEVEQDQNTISDQMVDMISKVIDDISQGQISKKGKLAFRKKPTFYRYKL